MIEKRFKKLWEQLQGKKIHMPHFLAQICIDGMRGINDLRVQFDYPVSVIAGGNASGKSTVLFAAACAYKVPGAGVKDYVPSTLFPDYRMIEKRFKKLWEQLQGKTLKYTCRIFSHKYASTVCEASMISGFSLIIQSALLLEVLEPVVESDASGKSTVLFAAACAYKVPGAGVKDYVPSTLFPDYRPKAGLQPRRAERTGLNPSFTRLPRCRCCRQTWGWQEQNRHRVQFLHARRTTIHGLAPFQKNRSFGRPTAVFSVERTPNSPSARFI